LGDEGDRGGCWAALFYFLSVDIGEDFVDEWEGEAEDKKKYWS
jgi:hypothetical protein